MKITESQLKQYVRKQMDSLMAESKRTKSKKIEKITESQLAKMVREEMDSVIKEYHVDPERSAAAKKNVISRQYEPKTENVYELDELDMFEMDMAEMEMEEKEYKAIPGMKKYKKSGPGHKDFDLSQCISDLKGKKNINNPAAVCRSADIAITGEPDVTRGKKREGAY